MLVSGFWSTLVRGHVQVLKWGAFAQMHQPVQKKGPH
jgi:hypothetical protein